jgi:Fe-S-cluster containining protein
LEEYDVTGESRGGMELHGAGFQDPTPPAAEPAVPGRSCGTCSLCCKVNPVQELSKPAGQWCIHCVPGSGCAIHADRPQACRAFFCGWRLDPNLGPEWKPEVCRFVLSADPAYQSLVVMADPGMPLAWKREPYYSRLKQLSEASFRQDRKVLLNLKGNITVILPDREIPLGVIAPGEEIVVWREGSAYGASLRRGPELPKTPEPRSEKTSEPTPSKKSQPAEARAGTAGGSPSIDDPGFFESVFREAFEKTCKLLDDPNIDDLQALTWSIRGRNKVLDATAETYAEAAGAECRPGCVSCCYLMVSGTPFEVLSIAQRLLETKTPAEIESLKERLRVVAEVPLDPILRVKAKIPCALLENDRCSAYELRPSVCRMALSQSRAACDACLKGAATLFPYIEPPSKVAAVMQMGIDYAFISRRNLSTEGAELSRALLIALADYQGALTSWFQGKDPFPGTHVGVPGAPSSRERTVAAARRLGIA